MYDKYYARNDFNPDDFVFEAYFDLRSPSVVIEYDVIFVPGVGQVHTNPRIAKNEDGTDKLSHKGHCLQIIRQEGYGEFEDRCQHCGQHIKHCCIFRNTINGELIVVGTVCADERMSLTLDQFRIRQEQTRVKAEETKAWHAEQVSAWLNEDSSRLDLIQFLAENDKDRFHNSLLNYFKKHGKLTQAQEQAACKSRVKFEQRKADEEIRLAQVLPVPNGNGLTIIGTVKSVKWQDNQFGGSYKMLVESEEGYRLWGTVPKVIDAVEVGDKVKFVANVRQSDNLFGFFSRPRKAQVI